MIGNILQNKWVLIFSAAFSVTLLVNFPRLMIMFGPNEIIRMLGVTWGDFVLRAIAMFGYAWVLLCYNLLWKERWTPQSSGWWKLLRGSINFLILFGGVLFLVLLENVVFPENFTRRRVFFLGLASYIVVQFILWLIVRVIRLQLQQQQDQLEKEQARQQALAHQLDALRNQINPHFLFNTLGSLTVLIRQQSDRALPFVDKLSWLLRATLQRGGEHFMTLADELAYLDSYLFLQKERFGEKLKVTIRIPEAWQQAEIPSFSLQLLVENAIKHNIASRNQPLVIEIYTENAYLVVKNPLQKRLDTPQSTGTGLANLSARFKLLKKRAIEIHQDDGFFTVRLPILSPSSHET